jgi:hypothetical protein
VDAGSLTDALWSGPCREQLARGPVRPFAPGGAADWEEELFELTGRRGMPVVGGVAFGRDAAPEGVAPATVAGGEGALTLAAWSSTDGALYFGPPRAPDGRRTVQAGEGPYVAPDHRAFLERLVRVAAMPSFPPPLVLLDLPAGPAAGPALAAALGLGRETAHDPPIFAGAEVLVLGGYPHAWSPPRAYARSVAALASVLAAAGAAGLPWFLDTEPLPAAAVLPETGPAGRASRRTTTFGVLDVAAGDGAIRCALSVVSAPVEEAVFLPSGGARRALGPAPAGSPRVARWAASRRVVRSAPRLAEAEVARWVADAGAPFLAPLADWERALGGFVAPGLRDPLGPPLLLFGLAATSLAPEALARAHRGAGLPADDAPMMMSCGVEEPQRVRHPTWRWRDHELVFLGEWRERYVFCDRGGALWLLHADVGDLRVVAASPATFLEQLALQEHLWDHLGHLAPVRVFADVGAPVAARLGLAPVPEASDELVQVHEGGGLWLWQQRAHGPSPTEMRVLGADLDRVVAAVAAARELAPGARIKAWDAGEALLDRLVAAGLGDRGSLTATVFQDAEEEAPPSDEG